MTFALAQHPFGGEVVDVTIISVSLEQPNSTSCVDRSGLKLATGAQQELKVWKYIAQDHLQHINDLSPPGAVSLTAQEPTFVTSLHWLHSGDDAGCLLATYLYQGIICREPESGETRWAIPLRSLIGHADLSPDETWITIFNQHNGIDVYKIPGAIWLTSYHFTIRDNVILPVYWIDEGLRLMAGSDSGTVCVWNVKNDSRLPFLLHGTAETGPRTSIHLFETKELREAGTLRNLQVAHKLHYRMSSLTSWIMEWEAQW
ncbi:uncharacterized protein HD556DRAFT_1313326 [Suillus plorans]|uniref:Uncharacterized protein n=1 Tax=Suillus plorans TaxID=116603 RepID=A0A9P7AEC0_9AGAM|nr:uncharacterized protein HD556DRAFT_1313326 [Suillus plorans]KAG1786703.1 hypothetical protein HD556DRAFT_1313326 [Suillus plorans]